MKFKKKKKVYSATNQVKLLTCISSNFDKAFLDAHNAYRIKHGAVALKQNATISGIAQKYANYLATKNLFEHSGAKGFGENLAYSSSSKAPNLTKCDTLASSFVGMWYNEIKSKIFLNCSENNDF